MKGRIAKWILLLLILPVLAGPAGCGPAAPVSPTEEGPAGYRAVCFTGEDFLAVGTGGRIDRIAPDRTMASLPCPVGATLNGVAWAGGRCVAVGAEGTVLLSSGEEGFRQVDAGVDRDLLAVTDFKDAFVAVGRGGTVITSPDGETWTPFPAKTEEDFLSVDSNGQTCLAVTRQGQVLILEDPTRGRILDYNREYKDLATTFNMRAVSSCGRSYLVMGTETDNEDAPVLFRTDDGEIWVQVFLDRINDLPGGDFYPLRLNAAGLADDQILVAAEGGELLTLTSCAECTRLRQESERPIRSLALSAEGTAALVGDGFWFEVLPADAARTYRIKAEQALFDQQQNAALIVDVRETEEYEAGHIPGALHLPLSRVADNLERLVPDKQTKLIFYCAVGGRSQTALETALKLGYPHVYNLGGLESGDWPFEVEEGAAGAFEE